MKGFVLPRTLSSEKQTAIQSAFPESSQYLIDNLQETLPAISLLGETALTSAYSNDKAPDLVFAQQSFHACVPASVNEVCTTLPSSCSNAFTNSYFLTGLQ